MSLTKTEMLKNSALEVSMASRVLMAEGSTWPQSHKGLYGLKGHYVVKGLLWI